MDAEKPASTPAFQRGPRDEKKGVLADRVLSEARRLFASRGFASTSLRMIADAAGVDVSLVMYYFASKAGLLESVMVLPPTYVAAVRESLAAPIELRGAALVLNSLNGWDDVVTGEILKSIVLAAAYEPSAMERLRSTFTATFLAATATALPDEERQLRAGLVAAQIVGMFMTRYVWKVGALAELPSQRVAGLVGPSVQRYLNGPLDLETSTR